MELICLICMYAALHVLLMCWDMLRFESRVTPRFLTDDTNGTSASPMWMTDGKGLWTDIVFESMIMVSVLLSFSWSLFAVIQDLTSIVQFWRVFASDRHTYINLFASDRRTYISVFASDHDINTSLNLPQAFTGTRQCRGRFHCFILRQWFANPW